MYMKKIVIIALIAIVGIVGILMVKNSFRFNVNFTASTPGAIMLTNDSSDTISVEYTIGDKKIDTQLPPREEITCGANGFVRVFTAQKSGSYELIYPNDSKVRTITLSQILAGVKKDAVENDIYTKSGMLGDVKITYEEVQQVGD